MHTRLFAATWITLATAPLLAGIASATPISTTTHASPSSQSVDAPGVTQTTAVPRSGVYILDRFETLEDAARMGADTPPAPQPPDDTDTLAEAAVGVLGDLVHMITRDFEAELEAGARAGWMEVDAEAGTATITRADDDAPQSATFAANFSRLVPDDSSAESMVVEVIDATRIALHIPVFQTHRLTWRRVERDSAEFMQVAQARERARLEQRAQHDDARAQLEAAARQRVTLDVRQSLPGGEVSFALPAQARFHGHHGDYWVSGIPDEVNIVAGDDDASAQALLARRQARFDTRATIALTLDDGIQVGRDMFGGTHVVASTVRDGQRYLLVADLKPDQLPTVLAMWRSLEAPVDRLSPLRTPDAAPLAHLRPADAFDTAVDTALAELVEPRLLLDARRVRADSTTEWRAPTLALQTDGTLPLRMSIDLAEGRPADVLERFVDRTLEPGTGLAFYPEGCRAHAVMPVDLGARGRRFSLILRQTDTSDYARCLTAAAALSGFDLARTRTAQVPRALLDQFSAYTQVLGRSSETLRVRGPDGRGMVAADGRILVEPRYESVDTARGVPGFVVRQGQRYGYVDAEGRETLPVEFESIRAAAGTLVAERDGRRGVYTTDGRALLPHQFDFIREFEGGRLLRLGRDKAHALYDPEAARFLVALEDGVDRIDNIRDRDRFLTRGAAGHALHDGQGRMLIGPADDIRRAGPDLVAVRETPEGGYRLHGLDGALRSEARYARVWFNRSEDLLSVTDLAGRRSFLDLDLAPRTPEGLNAVFVPTEGGYAVVADDGTPPRMGMAGPDLELVLPVLFRQVYSMREGLITAQAPRGTWGAWDATGTRVLAADWDALSQSFGGRMFASKDGRWRVIDRTGAAQDARRWSDMTLHFRTPGAAPFATARADHDGRWEVLDMEGSRVLDGTFDHVEVQDWRVRLHRGDEVIEHPAQ
ncbi:WG repeat-containing protein [Luteimonas terrae]|uniref:WG repeat-containing protein n=1 Tax=Luteimonas terrae TaxID=1530191 RepID=A0ABU1Y0S6_9GAMM|nr:WG repeat-containing protein [Luteimonas terrae]MDR7194628.1 hypothetical protein [Luteimonas terrae]